MNMERLYRCRRILAACLVLSVAQGRIGLAAEVSVSGRITYEIPEGVYVNVGTEQGLSPGLRGSAQLDDGQAFPFEVLHAARQSALLRLAVPPGQERLAGRTAELAFEAKPSETSPRTDKIPPPGEQAAAPSSRSDTTDEQGEFVPLLAPAAPASQPGRRTNVSHGRVQVRQMLQTDSQDDLGYAVTRLDSSGNIDRIEGSLWSFEWSGALRYRDGDAFGRHPEYREPHLDLYQASFHRPFDDGGIFRFGRFLPYQLPGIGFVDGLQGEAVRGQHVRLGVVGGFKPGRIDLEPSVDEPLVAGYATLEAGQRGGTYYSGTVGLLSSLYEGRSDRLALLLDQRADLGPRLSLYSTAAFDFDTGAAETRGGTRLSRLDVTAVSRLSSFLALRGGLDHWERPDHQAERDLLPFDDERFFDDGYWRYWIGSSQNLPWKLSLYEEVGFLDSDTTEDNPYWRVRATRTGLLGWQDASASVTLYSLAAGANDGYGLRVSGYLPLDHGRWIVQPATGFRVLETEPSEDVSLTYLSLRLDGHLSRSWTVFGGLTYFDGQEVGATLFELGARYAW
jgi:hypothetical protein